MAMWHRTRRNMQLRAFRSGQTSHTGNSGVVRPREGCVGRRGAATAHQPGSSALKQESFLKTEGSEEKSGPKRVTLRAKWEGHGAYSHAKQDPKNVQIIKVNWQPEGCRDWWQRTFFAVRANLVTRRPVADCADFPRVSVLDCVAQQIRSGP